MDTLDDYLNRGIKEIIDSHPQVVDILNDYGVGCGACDLGTCLLKDIMSVQPIAEDQEQALTNRIEAEL